MKRTDMSSMRRRRWMPLGLSLIGVGVLWLAGCQQPTPVADVTRIPTDTPTATALPPTVTNRPSATPTPRPTSTATASPSPTLPPALAPATPPPGDRSTWRLVPWTVDQADRLIAQTASQLLALEDDPHYGGVYGRQLLASQYDLLATAEQEALLRFPEAPQAERWRWDLAYNQGLGYVYPATDQAPELATYARLMSEGLNEKRATLETLPAWFAAHETRLALDVTPIGPASEAQANALVTIDGMAYFWVTRHVDTYTVVGLQSNLFYFREAGSHFKMIDVTGDGQPELDLSFSESNCCGFSTGHTLYGLTSGEPVRLTFVGPTYTFSGLSSGGDSSIEALSTAEPDGQVGLIFDSTYGDPFLDPCSIRQYDRYRWTGREFVWATTHYEILPPDEYDDRPFCNEVRALTENAAEADVVAQAAGHYSGMAAHAVLPLRVRFKLAEYQARVGQGAKAQSLLESLLAIPEGDAPDAETPWRDAARALLDDLAHKRPFLASCNQIPVCDWSAALTNWVGAQPALRADQLALNLDKAGVDLRGRGLLDVSPGGTPMWWWVLRNPHSGKRELWIVTQIDGVFTARAATTVVAQDEPRVTMHFTGNESNLYTVDDGQGSTLFQVWKDLAGGLLVTHYGSVDRTDPQLDVVQNAQFNIWCEALLAGQDPAVIREGLRDLRAETKGSDLARRAAIDGWIGLASELLGDERAAVEAYARAWDESPDRLQTIWIRLKLGFAP